MATVKRFWYYIGAAITLAMWDMEDTLNNYKGDK